MWGVISARASFFSLIARREGRASSRSASAPGVVFSTRPFGVENFLPPLGCLADWHALAREPESEGSRVGVPDESAAFGLEVLASLLLSGSLAGFAFLLSLLRAFVCRFLIACREGSGFKPKRFAPGVARKRTGYRATRARQR